MTTTPRSGWMLGGAALVLGAVLGAPLLLIGAGLARWRLRRARNANLKV